MNEVTRLADELVDALLIEEPVLIGARYGLRDGQDRLGDPSEDAQEKLRSIATRILTTAHSLAATVAGSDRLTLAVVEQQARSLIDRVDTRAVEYTVTDMFIAPAGGLLAMLPQTSFAEEDHAQAYLDRLAAIPDYLAAAAHRHRNGVRAGRTPVRRLVDRAVGQLDRHLADPTADPLLRTSWDSERFASTRDRLVTDVVRPAFAAYRETLAAEIAEHGRSTEQPGLCWMAGGEAAYALAIRVHTTTGSAPDDLHRVGRELVADVRAEFAEVGSRVFGTTEHAEIFERMRTDPALRWTDGEEVLATARTTIARAEQVAPRWFGRLPEQRCVVEPVPAAQAGGAPPAYYLAPALDGSRPGTYFANTALAEDRPRYNAEVYAFHEAVPGHHVQLTLAQELTDLPLLRRIADVTAYAEGWGLYCERLAEEMGLYSGDVARLGLLTLDSLRAARLVVDTGLHSRGWTRERAVEYLCTNTPMPRSEIETEVDRYIAWPGQALAYMVGRLEFRRLRAAAKSALGDRFDIRAFHDLVIGHGALPLSVLADVVTEWAATPGPSR
ncbi:DUF885 domain-containing protein [Jidongwangia harbinensis]|uniref:DUF885 domain-containing protein n=1 Tax=Jidongwangia harbinensis TaxID=2878561 RepID=UPI001CD9E865|nr:DUF885 domain-containing protein [Jidongwangia harbinensis]MCA2211556.1 DUF885 domain-containing protein [Jidongwangia harbinensis]